jgi:hypothetical protein
MEEREAHRLLQRRIAFEPDVCALPHVVEVRSLCP